MIAPISTVRQENNAYQDHTLFLSCSTRDALLYWDAHHTKILQWFGEIQNVKEDPPTK